MLLVIFVKKRRVSVVEDILNLNTKSNLVLRFLKPHMPNVTLHYFIPSSEGLGIKNNRIFD